MKDPSRNASLLSSFTFSGTITNIVKTDKVMQLTIRQDVCGKLRTDFKLLIPLAAVTTDEFPYVAGDTVLVRDALLYEKDSEVRLRISSMAQLSATTAHPGEFNALAFSGKIVETKKEDGGDIVVMEQDVLDLFNTRLEFLIAPGVKLEAGPKVGDIGLIHSALFYDKGGCFRARISRPTYLVLYTPDVVMNLGTIEAKEVFC